MSLAPAVNRWMSTVWVVHSALSRGPVSKGDQGVLCQECLAAGLEP